MKWTVPIILVVWLLAPILLGTIIILFRRSQRHARSGAWCDGCGFDLASIRDQVPRCPECGLEKDGHPVIKKYSDRTARRLDLMFGVLAIWMVLTIAVALLVFLFIGIPIRGGH